MTLLYVIIEGTPKAGPEFVLQCPYVQWYIFLILGSDWCYGAFMAWFPSRFMEL